MQLLTSPFFADLLSPSNCEKTLTLIWVERAGGKHPFRAGKIRAEINPSPQSHTQEHVSALSHTHKHKHTHIHTHTHTHTHTSTRSDKTQYCM